MSFLWHVDKHSSCLVASGDPGAWVMVMACVEALEACDSLPWFVWHGRWTDTLASIGVDEYLNQASVQPTHQCRMMGF